MLVISMTAILTLGTAPPVACLNCFKLMCIILFRFLKRDIHFKISKGIEHMQAMGS